MNYVYTKINLTHLLKCFPSASETSSFPSASTMLEARRSNSVALAKGKGDEALDTFIKVMVTKTHSCVVKMVFKLDHRFILELGVPQCSLVVLVEIS